MKYRIIAIIATVFLIACSGLGAADVLPKPVPENQVFTTTSIIEAVGAVSQSTSVVWQVGDGGLTQLKDPYYDPTDRNIIKSGSIAYATYSDSIITNGGQISEVKSFSMDTHGKTAGLYNVETSKVLTYTSQNGSSLMGAESYVLDVAGQWRAGIDDIVCVFSRGNTDIIPAFCNKVTASSKLTSVTTAQVQTIGGMTVVSERSDTPAALAYEISVTPDANSASGYADGIVSTTFTVSVMEGRYDGTIIPGTAAQAATDGRVERTFDDCVVDGCRALADLVDLNAPLTIEYVRDSLLGFSYAMPGDNDQVIISDGTNSATWTRDGDHFTGTWLPPDANSWGGDLIGAISHMGMTWEQFINEYAPNLGRPDGAGGLDADFQVVNTNLIWNTMDTWIPGSPGSPATGPFLTGFDELAATLTYIDTATVAGGISTFNKVFDYQSGISCPNC